MRRFIMAIIYNGWGSHYNLLPTMYILFILIITADGSPYIEWDFHFTKEVHHPSGISFENNNCVYHMLSSHYQGGGAGGNCTRRTGPHCRDIYYIYSSKSASTIIAFRLLSTKRKWKETRLCCCWYWKPNVLDVSIHFLIDFALMEIIVLSIIH